jgi:predicted nucleotide-binding protein
LPIASEKELRDALSEKSKWTSYCTELLSRLFDAQSLAEEFSVFDNVGIVSFGLSNRVETFKKDMDNRINCLESISERLPLIPQKQHKRFPTRIPERKSSSRDVFVVHGHDESARETLARFIEKLGLRAVILQEQPKGGRTIIEQLEEYSDVGFAIVLMTLDDIGVSVGETEESKLRARQNVIFEFGYFLGKLERNKVRILRKGDVEIPSDLQGVLYIPMDSAGAWRMELAKEIKNAGIDVDLNKVFSP